MYCMESAKQYSLHCCTFAAVHCKARRDGRPRATGLHLWAAFPLEEQICTERPPALSLYVQVSHLKML